MSAPGWIITLGGALAVAVLVWPASGTRWSMRVRTGPRRRTAVPAEPLAGAAAAAVTVVAGLAPGHAAAAAIGAVVCASALKILLASRRWSATAEGVARLAGVLANQASVAVTVTDAIARAAPLVSGTIRRAATALAADCEAVGVEVAAERFAARVPSSAARSLADLIVVSAEGGGRWAETVEVLEQEASQAAVTARMFHARVATIMPTLALVVVLGAGLIAGAAWSASDVGAWLAGPGGAMLLLAGSTVVAVLSARVLLPARAIARSGGRR